MIDLTKPVQTRDGRPVEILRTDLKCTEHPVAAVVTSRDGRQSVTTYTAKGKWLMYPDKECGADLVNVPEEYTVWVNVYEDPRVRSRLYATRTEADWHAGRSGIRIACIPVTYKEGEGL